MKPRVAVFDFAGCEGCELQIVNLEESLLELLDHIDVVSFREAMKEHSDDYDIAIVDGGITRQCDEARLKEIRENAKILIAMGACAHNGGIMCLKNFQDEADYRQYVYGDQAALFETYPARGLDAVVPVDYYVRGCPPNRAELVDVLVALLMGKEPDIPDYPVCAECKKAGNVCLFEKGEICLGVVARAGCGAPCPSNNAPCEGCRGLVPDPNVNAAKEVLQKHGLALDEVLKKFRFFCGYSEVSQ